MDKTKIIFLSNSDTNLYLFRLPVMKTLAGLNWEVIALSPNGRYNNRFREYGIRFISCKMDRKSLNPFRELKSVYDIYRILKKERPDVLHTFTHKPNIYGNIAGKLSGVPIIINSHTGEGSFFIESSFKARIVQSIIRILYRITLRFSTKITFLNYDDKRIFTEEKLAEDEKTEVIMGSGIDTEEWNPSKIQADKAKKLRVLMASRLIIHKGVAEYVEAARLLKKKYGGTAEFFLAGDFYDGNPYAVPKEYIKRAVQERVIEFLGWKHDLRKIVKSSDIFVLPSYREGCPKAVLEAMAMQKPIITTSTVGCKECVEDNKNGFLVPPKNVLKLAEAIEKLIQNKDLRKKFGRYSRQKCIEEFDTGIIIKRHLQMYQELLQRDLSAQQVIIK